MVFSVEGPRGFPDPGTHGPAGPARLSPGRAGLHPAPPPL